MDSSLGVGCVTRAVVPGCLEQMRFREQTPAAGSLYLGVHTLRESLGSFTSTSLITLFFLLTTQFFPRKSQVNWIHILVMKAMKEQRIHTLPGNGWCWVHLLSCAVPSATTGGVFPYVKSCLHPVPPEGALLGPTLAHAACGSRPSHSVSLGLGLNTIAGHDSYIP